MIQDGHEPRVLVTLNVNIQCDWFATILKKKFSPDDSAIMHNFPRVLRSVDDALLLLQFMNNTKFCIGNPDADFLDRWEHRSSTLYSGMLSCCRSLACENSIDYLLTCRQQGWIPRCLSSSWDHYHSPQSVCHLTVA